MAITPPTAADREIWQQKSAGNSGKMLETAQSAGDSRKVLETAERCWRQRKDAGDSGKMLATAERCWRQRKGAGDSGKMLETAERCWKQRKCAGNSRKMLDPADTTSLPPRQRIIEHARTIARLVRRIPHSCGRPADLCRQLREGGAKALPGLASGPCTLRNGRDAFRIGSSRYFKAMLASFLRASVIKK